MKTCKDIYNLYQDREPESQIHAAFGEVAVNDRDEKFGNFTPLHLACYFGDEGAVRILLEHGAFVNAKDRDGYTPLCTLGMYRYTYTDEEKIAAAARLLLEKGADVPRSAKWTTALLEAIRQMHFRMAEEIVESGARIDSTDTDGQNALHIVCLTAGNIAHTLRRTEERLAYKLAEYHSEKQISEIQAEIDRLKQAEEAVFNLTKKLLESGRIDSEEKNNCGKTPLDMAMQEGAMHIGTLLAGHNPEDVLAARVGGMDVFQALFHQNGDALDALLQQGVELQTLCEHREMCDFLGKSPLACALAWSNFDAAERILCAGADPNFRMMDEQTAFAVWMEVTDIGGAEETYICTLELMLQQGWNPEASADREGNTALALACRHVGYAPGKTAVRFLLEKRVNTDVANLCGQTPLMILYGGGYWDGRIPPLPMLPRSYPYGWKYCGEDEAEVLEWLLEAGADARRRDKWGNSLLHYIAASCYNTEARQVAEVLADFPLPDIAWTNNEGLAAIDLATDKGSESFVKFLLRHFC